MKKSIVRRLFIGTVLLFILILIQGGLLHWMIQKEHSFFNEIIKQKEYDRHLAEARYHHRVWMQELESALIIDRIPDIEDYTRCRFGEWLYSLKPDEEQGRVLESIKAVHLDLHQSARQVINFLEEENLGAARTEYFNNTLPYSNLMENQITKLETIIHNKISELEKNMQRFSNGELLILAILTITLITAAVIYYHDQKETIVKPILNISRAMERVENGDYNVEVTNEDVENEIGYLAKNFNHMLEPLKLEKLLRNSLQSMVDTNDLNIMLEELVKNLVEDDLIETAAIYLYDEWEDTLYLKEGYLLPENINKQYKLGEGLVGQVAAGGKMNILYEPDAEWNVSAGLTEVPLKSIAAVPIMYQGKILGVILLGSLKRFSQRQMDAFTRVAFQLGIAINNIKHYNSIQKLVEKLSAKNRDLHEQKKYVEAVLRSSAEGICSIDLNGVVKSWSKGAERITGYKAEEIIGRRCCDLLKHSDPQGNELCKSDDCYIAMIVKDKRFIKGRELLTLRKDGRRIPCFVSAAPIYDENDNVIGAVEVFRDITREKENLQRIRQANKAKSEFLATMSHELRTPLNSVLGFSELLESGAAGQLTDKQKRYLNNIIYSGRHLLSLINDILDISKIESGKMEWEPSSFNLVDLLKNSLVMVKERANKAGVELKLDIIDEEKMAQVEMDERKVKQIVYNLLTNAIKFTPKGGKVGVEARRNDDIVEIKVWDTGIGIPKEKQKIIFEPFIQLDSSLSRKHEGAGLGLNLVKKMVELGSGKISVASTPGEGSTFTVELPAILTVENIKRITGKKEVEADDDNIEREIYRTVIKDVSEEETSESNGSYALVIEDDPGSSHLVREYLKEFGYNVVIAENGERGLQLAREYAEQLRLITLDIMLPGMDGWDVLASLKENESTKDIPVVIISILPDKEKGLALGAVEHLVKPFKRDDIIAVIKKLCSKDKKERCSVLAIDDEPIALEIIEETLSSEKLKVHKAYSGKEGVEKAVGLKPAVIILDIMMPEMDGFEVYQKLQEIPETRDIPVIILTSKILTQEEKKILYDKVYHISQKSELKRDTFKRAIEKAIVASS